MLFLRVFRQDADTSLPAFLKPLLGGVANLRGFDPGQEVGDTLVAGTIEVLVPVNSPLTFARVGVSVFSDAGAAYNKGQRLSDQTLLHSYGAGVWFAAAFLRLSIDVAHGVGGSTHVQLGGTVAF